MISLGELYHKVDGDSHCDISLLHPILLLGATLLACLSCSSSAGEFAYTCEVHPSTVSKKGGSLKTNHESQLEKLMKESFGREP